MAGMQRKAYDAGFKLEVVKFAEANGNRKAANKYAVDRKRVREWRKQKASLKLISVKKKRVGGGGRKLKYPI